ncbi:hypothetical protein HK098_001027 [Nowakowskiella sp. JEL0407]|nr:hypothetical protein HK098_001027 [Nowakowskiella sp. JEL0407]
MISLTYDSTPSSHKKPVVFASGSHIGQLSVTLRSAEGFAIENPAVDVYIISTDDVIDLINTYTSRIPNLFFKSYGNASALSSEMTQKAKKLYKNGPNPYALFEIALDVEKRFPPFKTAFQNFVEIFKDIQPRLVMFDIGCAGCWDAVSYCGLQFIVIIPTFASYGFPNDYNQSALCVGHAYSGTNALKPTVQSVLTSWLHRNTYLMCALYTVFVRGLFIDRITVCRENNINNLETTEYADARAVISACNWGIEYPVRFRPNVHLVGPVLPDVIPFTESPTATDSELLEWIDSDCRGIIFISLGSLNIMENWEISQFIEQLTKAVHQHNVRVIWKFSKSSHNSISKELQVYNVSSDDFKLVSWVDNIIGLLGHPKIVLNINHAGGNSFNEALYFGVPQLWIPLWVDCYDLAVRGEVAELGISVDCKNSYKGVGEALSRILTDEKYKRNAMFWSERCRVDGGREKVLRVINNVIRELEIEEKYGMDYVSVNKQVNKVIQDPGFVGNLFFGVKMLLFISVFGLGWFVARSS